MVQMHDQNNPSKKISTLTCPARLFVKKVRKFPQFKVPIDSDPKVLRQLQEHSLRHVRQSGFESGETRFEIVKYFREIFFFLEILISRHKQKVFKKPIKMM